MYTSRVDQFIRYWKELQDKVDRKKADIKTLQAQALMHRHKIPAEAMFEATLLEAKENSSNFMEYHLKIRGKVK